MHELLVQLEKSPMTIEAWRKNFKKYEVIYQ